MTARRAASAGLLVALVIGLAAGPVSPASAQSDWSTVSSPNRFAAETVDYLDDVACVTASDCWSVGYYSAGRYSGGVDLKTLVEHWDGTAWTVVESPNADALVHNYLTDVTCVSATDCWAVGYYGNPTGSPKQQTLILRWDGAEWTLSESPNTSVDEANLLHAVTCDSATDCWAVGHHSTPTGTETLTMRWDGSTWKIVPSPNGVQLEPVATPYGSSALYNVACASATSCWAVGNFYNGLAYQTLIEHWDGSAWTVVASANANPAGTNNLYGVACASESECWAVGSVATGSVATQFVSETLILRWDGDAWSLSPSPNSPGSNALYDVTCTSASACFAVGAYDVNGDSKTLAEHWDGLVWTIADSPNATDTQPNVISGVACVAATQCWAVGWSGGFAFETLTERWDGTAWGIIDSPNPRALADHFLADVACPSATECWAVGHDHAGNARQHLIERWNGTAWTIFSSPTRSADHDHHLSSVTCMSATDCWAVGHELTTGVAFQTFVQHWDGTAWATVPSPNTTASEHNVLSSVTCLSATDCWAVGHTGPWASSGRQTLIQRWDGSSWTIVSSPNLAGSTIDVLSEVTCLTPSECWAVGHSSADGADRTLIEHWDGTAWTIVGSPDATDSPASSLSGVTCASTSDCWAVGSSYSTDDLTLAHGDNQTLVVRWDGTGWALAGSPQPGSFSDVTCASPSKCWAVGATPGDVALQSLVERGDGSSWSRSSSSNTDTAQDNVLSAVACASARQCWTVGHRSAGLIAQTLVQRYVQVDATDAPATPTPEPTTQPVPEAASPSPSASSGAPPEATRACRSRRRFRIHIGAPRGFRVRSATLRIGSRSKRVRVRHRGRRFGALVDLRGLAPGRTRVRFTVRGRDGVLRTTRLYRLCAPGPAPA